MNKAYELGFPPGTTIYFAVDYDAYDFEVQNNIIPYMASIRRVFDAHRATGRDYKVGVYGARNTCIQCMTHSSVRADHSFVANMSTGFSGNLGFPMPTNWSFGQFYETDIYSNINGTNVSLRIDKNDYSGLDQGAQYIQPRQPIDDPVYEARHKAWTDIGTLFPILKDSGLFTKSFTFNTSHEVIRTTLVDVDVTTSATYSIPGDVDSVVIEVENFQPKATLREALGEMFGEFSSDRLADYQKAIDNLSATIGNGFVSMTFTQNADEFIITVSAYKDKIEVEGGNDISLAITVTYTFKNPLAIDYRPVLVAAGIAVGAVALGALVYLTIPALSGATAIATIVSLLVGAFNPDA
ncbi:glycoside hydrolase domain-containing protein [Oceanobacillus sp. AG]|uniref:glycoside hydrolase domain-containing protein n=1 Tax=Oceanobacillus sp. AG TaxID=2681969 RepID=UPI0018DC3930|nr:glycoside hydrolase domain-containing protein [Oceanobacillus sp. AG]